MLFGTFFDGLHQHLGTTAPACGLMLGSGRSVPFLCYADDVVLLSGTSQGLQLLIDSMHGFCVSMGLTISVAKTEVVVFHGADIEGSWSLHGLALPRSSSFKYLGLVFHESGGLGPMLRQLHSAGQGARAKLQANYGRLGCTNSVPMLLRLFSAVVAPALSYGCEVWGSQLQGKLDSDAKKLQGVQSAFLRGVCGRLPVGIPMPAILNEVAQDPCTLSWWVQLVRFAVQLSAMPSGSLHRDTLRDNILDAFAKPAAGNWAAQVIRQFRSLGLPAPFAHDGTVSIDKSSFRTKLAGKHHEVWQGLHVSPRSAPSKGAKLCTYHRWFARIGPVSEPYYHLPLSDRSLRRLFRFRLGAHSLPVEMGRRLRMARVARVCPLCPGMHVGDERHYVFDCPSFDDIRMQHSRLFDDSHGAMRLFMWHPHQKGVASCLLQMLDRIDQLLT